MDLAAFFGDLGDEKHVAVFNDFTLGANLTTIFQLILFQQFLHL
jgi:hypothetical protein